MIGRLVKQVKNVTFLWLFAASFIASSAVFIDDNLLWINANFTSVLFVSISALWVKFIIGYLMLNSKVDRGLLDIKIGLLKSDVDRFFNDHKNDKYLTEDEMSYVYMLRDKCKYYGVNSFTLRKIEHLLKKDIK